jgi:non-ribosomal peptide synthetase component F
MIGHFVNLQCIRIKVEGESFEQLVQAVRTTTISCFANQDVPFERIMTSLRTKEDPSRHPLIQIIFAFHPYSQSRVGDFTLEELEVQRMQMLVSSSFDLELHLYQEEHAIQGGLIFSTDLYDDKTIDKMCSTFLKGLEHDLTNSTATISPSRAI